MVVLPWINAIMNLQQGVKEMRSRLTCFTALCAVAAFTMPAFAGPALTANQILDDFNGVIYTNASTPSDVEGSLVVGGNLNAATIYNNPNGSEAPVGFGALTVYGSTSGNSINLNNGGSAYVAGTEGAHINFNGGGGYISAPGYAITNFEAPLNALSIQLAGMTTTSSLPPTDNNEIIKATPGANGIAVFNITAAQLDAIPSYSINVNGASTVVFNVSGNNIDFKANDQSGTTGAKNIIWNFYNATSVDLETQIAGTILAPDAAVTNGNQIDGTLVADSWNGTGELHEYAFAGTLPPIATVVEPASVAMLGIGLFGIGLTMRRRKAA